MKLGLWYCRIQQRRAESMPWKDFNFLQYLLSAYVLAPTLAFATSFIRICYDENEPRYVRAFLESMICGLLTLSFTAGIRALGWDSNWAVFIGGFVGFLGADYIRFFARDLLRRRTDTQSFHHTHTRWDDKEGDE